MDCNFFMPVNESCGFTEDLRYLNTKRTENERALYENYFTEQIGQYGVEVDYIVNGYELSSHNPIYGEHTTKQFADPVKVVMYVIFNSDSIVLNQFGIESDGDITAFIPIKGYEDVFGDGSEPKSGDLIRLTEYGETNRPNDRGAQLFEITFRDDEVMNQTNPLMGHYVWIVKGRRLDYSYENNVTPENVMNQVHDGNREYSDDPLTYQGDDVTYDENTVTTEEGNPELSSITKTYDSSADELGSLIFDYDTDTKSNDSVYGDY